MQPDPLRVLRLPPALKVMHFRPERKVLYEVAVDPKIFDTSLLSQGRVGTAYWTADDCRSTEDRVASFLGNSKLRDVFIMTGEVQAVGAQT